MRIRRLAVAALLTAVSLTIFVVEAQIPVPVPVPGLKLGLSNAVTVFALAALGWKTALAILLVRIVLGNLLLGQVTAMLYALAGGLLSFLCMALLIRRVLRPEQLWVAGAVGGLAHNAGQMAAALAVTQTPGLLWYLPVLLLCGLAAGSFTGLSAQLVLSRLNRRKNQ